MRKLSFLLFTLFISLQVLSQGGGTSKSNAGGKAKTEAKKKSSPPVAKKKATTVAKASPLKVKEKKIASSAEKISAPVVKKEKSSALFSRRENAMLDEINFLRSRPKEYKAIIEEYLKLRKHDPQFKKAVDELLIQLEKLSSLNPLQVSENLYNQAKIHGQWMQEADMFEHSEFQSAENLIAGVPNIRDAIISLLVDASDIKRGHRMNLLHSGYKFIGLYEVPGTVAGMSNVFVQEFSYKK